MAAAASSVWSLISTQVHLLLGPTLCALVAFLSLSRRHGRLADMMAVPCRIDQAHVPSSITQRGWDIAPSGIQEGAREFALTAREHGLLQVRGKDDFLVAPIADEDSLFFIRVEAVITIFQRCRDSLWQEHGL